MSDGVENDNVIKENNSAEKNNSIEAWLGIDMSRTSKNRFSDLNPNELKELRVSDLVPKGGYCYDENGTCPFWRLSNKHEKQNNGYCSLLRIGDWEWEKSGNSTLLWDQCKECGINDELEN